MPSSAQDELCNPRLKEDSPLLGIQDFVVLPTNDYGALMREIDPNGDGSVTYAEFLAKYGKSICGDGFEGMTVGADANAQLPQLGQGLLRKLVFRGLRGFPFRDMLKLPLCQELTRVLEYTP